MYGMMAVGGEIKGAGDLLLDFARKMQDGADHKSPIMYRTLSGKRINNTV